MSYKADKGNPFGGGGDTSLTNVDKAIFGEVGLPASGRVVAKPVEITSILPDRRQPRRAMPSSVRRYWDGSPEKIGDLLSEWKLRCEGATGEKIPKMSALLMNEVDFPQAFEEYGGIVEPFVDVVRLAQSIYAEGLQNPITIYERNGQKYIQTGERRYLAHWLLYSYLDRGQWGKIPATTVLYSVRQQITENTSRRDLNAIGLARSYALIVMALYEEEGQTFQPFEALVEGEGCDRAYYAQVAMMQVPRGRGQDVRSVLNVTNRSTTARYKVLLTLPDEVWLKADDENWSLRQCLDWFEAQKPQPEQRNVAHVQHFSDEPEQSRENVTHVPHSDDRGLQGVKRGQSPEQPYNPSIPSRGYPHAPTPPVQDESFGWDDDPLTPHPPLPQGERGSQSAGASPAPDDDERGEPEYLLNDPTFLLMLDFAAAYAEKQGDKDMLKEVRQVALVTPEMLAEMRRDEVYQWLQRVQQDMNQLAVNLMELTELHTDAVMQKHLAMFEVE